MDFEPEVSIDRSQLRLYFAEGTSIAITRGGESDIKLVVERGAGCLALHFEREALVRLTEGHHESVIHYSGTEPDPTQENKEADNR